MYVDVYNIEQPKATDITNNQKISLTIDLDDTYMNGANAFGEVNDNFNSLEPMTNSVTKISILDASVDSNFIRATQTLTIKMDMGLTTVFASNRNLYL